PPSAPPHPHRRPLAPSHLRTSYNRSMTDKDIFVERERALEDDYFRRRDLELIEKMRQQAAAERERSELRRMTGLYEPEMLEQLRTLGFTPETIVLLPLMPALQVAWAD